MWTVASTTEALTTAFSNSGTIIATTLASVLVGVVALMGLGFGYRHLKKYITGKKF